AAISKAGENGEMQPEKAQQVKQALAANDGRKRIIIDAGHGGADVGTTGVSTGRQEKEVNLEIAKKLQNILEGKGYEVIMTRTTDDMIASTKEEDMRKREDIIKDADADMFVSIHQNFFEKDEDVSGPQVFYRDQTAKGYELAQYMQEELNGRLEINVPRDVNAGDYQLLRPGEQASVIVECGFFSNPQEEQKLQEDGYQQAIVEAVDAGIGRYFLEKGQ
ncbi:MAG: N-acetylmuramoyl-L-alanine amidase, partial [Christensenella sp.]|uniref:N-acetylmuramoyl-L-alanine amidase family protein n=1 Tax=Christensenella sp. TaxID=1935934 RepID=UPI002B220A74